MERKVEISPVHELVPHPPQLLALKEMLLAGAGLIKGGTYLLHRKLKRFTEFYGVPSLFFSSFFGITHNVVVRGINRDASPHPLYLLKEKHSCFFAY